LLRKERREREKGKEYCVGMEIYNRGGVRKRKRKLSKVREATVIRESEKSMGGT
jgi:hypothetical protein